MAFPPKCLRLLVDLSLSLPAGLRHPKFAWLSGEARGNPAFPASVGADIVPPIPPHEETSDVPTDVV
jgi:hypothetical protein